MKISKPGEYEGYSEECFAMGKGHSQYVPMRDGVKLAVDYYLPHEGDKELSGSFPALLILTPYPYRKEFNDKSLPIYDQFTLGEKMVRRGYAFIIAEVRGTGVSYGSRKLPNGPSDTKDAYDLLQWIGESSWCDGNVGMAGFSYFGGTQLSALICHSPYLKACFIGMTDLDKYDGWVRGGVVRRFGTKPDADYRLDLNNPCVEEDTDGSCRAQAVEGHRYSNALGKSMTDCPYRDSVYEIEHCRLWETVGKSYYLEQINSCGAKVYLYGGWRDEFRRDTVLMYENLTLEKKMLIGDWIHMDGREGFDMDLEHIRFFDYALKGIQNHINEEPPIYFATAGRGMHWEFAHSWPVPAEKKRLYLGQKALEAREPAVPFEESYKADYEITENFRDSLETVSRQEHGWNFYSDILQEDLLVTGHALLHLHISCSEPDADLFFSLIDVDESGKGRYVTDGIQRLSLRKVCGTPHYEYMDLPWHRANAEDEALLTEREWAEVITDLLPTSYLFCAGHRVLLSITTACEGYWYQKKEGMILTLRGDGVEASYIELPVRESVEEARV